MRRATVVAALVLGLVGVAAAVSSPEPPGHDAPSAATRREAVRKAVAWLLAARQNPKWDAVSATMANDAAKREVTTVFLALLLEIHPDDADAKARADIRAEADHAALRGESLGFVNWLKGFAALYAWERSLREGTPHPAVDPIARGFLDRQNAEGGWGHTTSRMIDFYPDTLIATSNLALLALGAAGRLHTPVSREPRWQQGVDDALKLYRTVQTPSGSMPYGGLAYRKGPEAGRTAAMVLALSAVARKDELLARALPYALRNLETVPHGHASPALHVALGGLCFAALGDDPWRQYQRQVLSKVHACQQPDGSFGDILGTSPDSMEVMGDALFRTAYRTALYSLALCADESALVRELRLPAVQRPKDKEPPPTVPVAWRMETSHRIEALAAAAGDIGAALTGGGELILFDMPTGKRLRSATLDIDPTSARTARLALTADYCVVIITPATANTAGKSMLVALEEMKRQRARPSRILCYDIARAAKVWETAVPGTLRDGHIAGGDALVTTLDGELTAYRLADGTVTGKLPPVPAIVNTATLRLPSGAIARTAESELTVYDPTGREWWFAKTRSLARGLGKPAYGRMVVVGDSLLVGRTDGRVEARSLADGKLGWAADLGQAVSDLCPATGGEPGLVVALSWGGFAHALQGGKVVWRTDLARGADVGHPCEGTPTAAGLLVAVRGRGVVLLDPATGTEKAVFPWRQRRAAAGRTLVTADGMAVEAYRLP
jgi:outer membrane protein assembly factor BamB